jgi:hypothetical protein
MENVVRFILNGVGITKRASTKVPRDSKVPAPLNHQLVGAGSELRKASSVSEGHTRFKEIIRGQPFPVILGEGMGKVGMIGAPTDYAMVCCERGVRHVGPNFAVVESSPSMHASIYIKGATVQL